MENRLSLYNSKLTIRLNESEKKQIKKCAYKNKITLSEYIRLLITINNRNISIENNLNKIDKSLNDIYKAKVRIGRNEK